ncbi:HD domain-containing protein [Streptomyces sp. SGAir0957]
MMSVHDVDLLAGRAHAGQVDKAGVAYVEHVRAVAAGLAPFGDELVMAGLLHDVLEDTDWTADELVGAGVPGQVVEIVHTVTNQAGMGYEEKIRRIAADPRAVLVKIADNAHNSRPDRAARLSEGERERLAGKYRAARRVLWPAADPRDVETIVRVVNPSLLTEVGEAGELGELGEPA